MMASSGERAKHATTFCLWLGLAAVSACAGSRAAHAADLAIAGNATNPAPVAPVPWLFGDWDGARTRLLNAGIDFQFGYTSEIAGNDRQSERIGIWAEDGCEFLRLHQSDDSDSSGLASASSCSAASSPSSEATLSS